MTRAVRVGKTSENQWTRNASLHRSSNIYINSTLAIVSRFLCDTDRLKARLLSTVLPSILLVAAPSLTEHPTPPLTMSSSREPLSARNLNTPLTPTPRPRKLAPIFTKSYKRSIPSISLSPPDDRNNHTPTATAGPSTKRARVDLELESETRVRIQDDPMDLDDESDHRLIKGTSMHDWFITLNESSGYSSDGKESSTQRSKRAEQVVSLGRPDVWRRPRRRFGIRLASSNDFRRDTMASMSAQRCKLMKPRCVFWRKLTSESSHSANLHPLPQVSIS